jgi:hypothetical protein
METLLANETTATDKIVRFESLEIADFVLLCPAVAHSTANRQSDVSAVWLRAG